MWAAPFPRLGSLAAQKGKIEVSANMHRALSLSASWLQMPCEQLPQAPAAIFSTRKDHALKP